MTVHYNPKMRSVVALATWRGTILQTVLTSSIFWLLMCVHLAFLYLEHEHPIELPRLNYSATGSLLGLSTFFLVFYSGSCFSRYYMLWKFCVGIRGTITEWVADVKLYFPGDEILQWNLCRLMLAAYQIQMCMVDEGKLEGTDISDAQYRGMQSNNLLSRAECVSIKEFKGFKPFLPMTWALDEVRKALKADEKLYLMNFRGQAFAFRACCLDIIATLDMHVPFPYFHVVKMMLVVSLLVLSYGMVQLLDGEPIFSVAVFASVAIVMFGLEAIAIDMADPFGDDDTDFDTDEMIRKAYEGSVALLRDKNEHKHDAQGYGDDVGNPATRKLPAKIAPGTTLEALVREMGDAIHDYDWSEYTLEEDARTYGSHSAAKQMTREHSLLRASSHMSSMSDLLGTGEMSGYGVVTRGVPVTLKPFNAGGAPPPPPPPPPPPSDLPPGWESVTDPSSGKTYFVHRPSGTSQWDPPAPPPPPPPPPPAKGGYGAANGDGHQHLRANEA